MWKNKYPQLAVLLGLFCLFWYAASCAQQYIIPYQNMVRVYSEEVAVNRLEQAVFRVEQAGVDLPPLLAWTQQESQSITGYLNRQTEVEMLTYWGDASLFFNVSFVSGSWPTDDTGCVLDEHAADALWGSAQVIGQKVKYGEKSLQVTGVIPDRGGVVFLPATETETVAMSDFVLDLSAEQNGIVGAQMALQRLKISGSCYDYGLPVFLAQLFSTAAAMVMIVQMCWSIVSMHRRMVPIRLLTVISAGLCLAGLAVLIWGSALPAIPSRMLPTRWSDFDFWTEQFAMVQKTLLIFLKQGGTWWEIDLWKTLFTTCLFGGLAAVAFLFVLQYGSVQSFRMVWLGCSAWWIILFVLIWNNRYAELALPGRNVWCAFPIWFILNGFMRRFKNWIYEKKEG